ncbi:hypothetical protein CGL56_15915 [Neolewinella marina]|uniref:TTHB210-like domain-containing protein n=1 Tax=Neolewinella marina TaxID=438751 RepID=A0A2G0CCB2_9BACT|nr:hypothetical protein CGL56_15915 [Neolewinella marina]
MVLSFSACQDDEKVQTRFTGPEIAVGNGQAWTVVNTDRQGNPLSLSVEFGADALEGLPTGQHHPPSYVLRLPTEVALPPYDHVTLDWNEHGHDPSQVYDIPHFDFHFYFITEAERDRIGPDDSLAFNKPLAPEHLPAGYLETPGGVPRMGAHIIDLQSPEIRGDAPFTYTFIYGKYDAELIFLEPMITTDYLRTKPDMTAEVRQPQEWQQAGFYPTEYRISYDAATDRYAMTLQDFVSVP